MFGRRWLCVAPFLLCGTPSFAQDLDERPKTIPSTPNDPKLTASQRQAEELRRQAMTLYAVGLFRSREERRKEAVSLLVSAAKLDPESNEIRRSLGEIHVTSGRPDAALDQFRKILERDPLDATTAVSCAKLLRKARQPNRAYAVLEAAQLSPQLRDRVELRYEWLREMLDCLDAADRPDLVGDVHRAAIEHLKKERNRLVKGGHLADEEWLVRTADHLEKLGRWNLDRKKYDESVALYREARDLRQKAEDIQIRSQSAKLSWQLCEVEMSRERWDEALRYVDAYLDTRPLEPEGYEAKAKILRKLKREREVMPALEGYAKRFEKSLGAQFAYLKEVAAGARNRRDIDAVAASLLNLTKQRANSEIYRTIFAMYARSDEMMLTLNVIDQAAKEMASEAQKEREKGREQFQAATKALRDDPQLVKALFGVVKQERLEAPERRIQTWLFLAGLAADTNQLKEAEQAFRICLTTMGDATEAMAYQGLLDVLRASRQYEAIIKLCREVIDGRKARNTNPNLFHRSLVSAYSQLDKYNEALAELEMVIKTTPAEYRMERRKEKVHLLIQAKRLKEATEETESMRRDAVKEGEIRTVRFAMCELMNASGKPDEAEGWLRQIIDEDPNDPLANNNLGYHLADRNRNLDEAERLIRRAIESDRLYRDVQSADADDNASYLDSLGWVLFRQNRLKEAKTYLERAKELRDGRDSAVIWDHLGDTLFKMDDIAGAKQSWQKALELAKQAPRSDKEARPVDIERKLKVLGRE